MKVTKCSNPKIKKMLEMAEQMQEINNRKKLERIWEEMNLISNTVFYNECDLQLVRFWPDYTWDYVEEIDDFDYNNKSDDYREEWFRFEQSFEDIDRIIEIIA